MSSPQPADGVVVDTPVCPPAFEIAETYQSVPAKKRCHHRFCFGLNKKTLLLAGLIGGVVAVLFTLYIQPYYVGGNKAGQQEWEAEQLLIRQTNDVYYRQLRQAVIRQLYQGSYDPSIFLRPNSPQRLAMEWMAYQDWPHVPLLSNSNSTTISTTTNKWMQRFVLMTIFFANNGHTWGLFNATATDDAAATASVITTSSSWASHVGMDECQWELIGCDNEGRLTTLSLGGSSVSLSGTLAKEIGLLTSLRHLDLSENHLEGALPQELYDLTHLGM